MLYVNGEMLKGQAVLDRLVDLSGLCKRFEDDIDRAWPWRLFTLTT
jgi:hypothetical protein